MDELELRILSGAHAGASAPLGGDTVVLGTHPDCELVLTDAGLLPRHASLSPIDGGWRLQWLAGGFGSPPPPAPADLAAGMSVALGPVLISVDSPRAPWPTLEHLVVVQAASELPAEPEARPAAETAQTGTATASPKPLRRQAAAIALLGLALAVAGPMALWTWADGEPAEPVPQAAAAPQPTAGQRAELERVIGETGLMQRVKIKSINGAWHVQARYLDDAAAERLGTALSRMRPIPAVTLGAMSDLPIDVAEELARRTRSPVTARHLGGLRFRLDGQFESDAERIAVSGALRAAFPEVQSWDGAAPVVREDGARLLRELHGAGYTDASGQWQGDSYLIHVRLRQNQVAHWESTLARAVALHPVPMRAQLTFDAAASQQAQAPSARLPFQVRTVVAGDFPYVVLADGAKVVLGGAHGGWKLSSIDERGVTFVSGGLRAFLPK